MPLTEHDLRTAEQALLRERAQLLGELQRETHDEDGTLSLSNHRGESDRSVNFELEAVDLAQTLRDDAQIRRVDAALQRLHDGSYGVCPDCGEDIDPQRLRAEPTAWRCAACQLRFEKTHAAGA